MPRTYTAQALKPIKVNTMTYLFNTTIFVPDSYPAGMVAEIISAQEAAKLLQNGFTSAIGHQGSADVVTAVTGVPVDVNRIQASMEVGDKAVCLKLRGRIPEGSILTKEECDAIGYDFILMERTA